MVKHRRKRKGEKQYDEEGDHNGSGESEGRNCKDDYL